MSEPYLRPEMLEELYKPFPPELIQWKAQATSQDKTRALGVPYVDMREYIDRLNQVDPCWSDRFEPLTNDAGVMICNLTVGGITRSDIGETDPGDRNTATSSIAQAFKRACVKFGLGRHLYEMPKEWAEYDGRRGFTPAGLKKLENLARKHIASGNGSNAERIGDELDRRSVPQGTTITEDVAKATGAQVVSNEPFASKEDAIQWGYDQGCFKAYAHARNAYNELKREKNPPDAYAMAPLWREEVYRRMGEPPEDE